VPPYVKAKSKAQAGKLFALAKEGKMSMADAKGKTKGVAVSKLPSHVKSRSKAKTSSAPQHFRAKMGK
jgi:hypothetical protein